MSAAHTLDPDAPDARMAVVFTLEGTLYGLRASLVTRVAAAVEITPLPKAPPIVMGVINLAGSIVPVVDVRGRFRLPPRPLRVTDRLIVARAGSRRSSRSGAGTGRLLAFVVDSVPGVQEIPAQATVSGHSIIAGLEHLEGVAKTDLGIVLIHDLAAFLSLEEEATLSAALPERAG